MKFLTLSLYHPRVMKGGAQYVAKDLHDAAAADPQLQVIDCSDASGAMDTPEGIFSKIREALAPILSRK